MIAETSNVGVLLETARMTVAAGESTDQEIGLVNRTMLPDNFDLSVEGLPSGWYNFSTTSVHLFPNWNEKVKFNLELSDKVRPNVYVGRIIARSRSQPNIKTEIKIEVEVLAPLKVEARLQPHKATGFKADFKVVLRNRSMIDSLVSLKMVSTTEFCNGVFTPPNLVVAGGSSAVVGLKVSLKPKAGKVQALQLQPFQVLVQPQWNIGPEPIIKPELKLEGEYMPRSRWAILSRHPRIIFFVLFLILFYILWSIVILPTIQNWFMLSIDYNLVYKGQTNGNSIRVEQAAFTKAMEPLVPMAKVINPEVHFYEVDQVAEIKLSYLFITANFTGHLQVDPLTGNLSFKADNPKQLSSFPWLFGPPDQVVQRLNLKLKNWLRGQIPPQKLTRAEIEGNTLFLRLKPCTANEPGCP